jgi:hypothetical protein
MDNASTPSGIPLMRMPRHEDSTGGRFQPGWRGGPGRPRHAQNRPRADLSQLIMDAATETGFIKRDEKGERGKEIRAEPFAAAWQGDWTTAGGHKWFKTFQAPGLVLEQHPCRAAK